MVRVTGTYPVRQMVWETVRTAESNSRESTTRQTGRLEPVKSDMVFMSVSRSL
jgi:hypothetical protein